MLYIMRHGKTEWNERHKLQGRTDIPLNEDGKIMAENAGKEYNDVHFDVCYCSPLIRAKETAEIVLKMRNVPIITDERLLEMSFGVYEGIENSFQLPNCPINVLFKKPEKYITPVKGGESFEDLYKRTGEFIKNIINPQLDQGKDILIVGHAAVNSSIVCQIRSIPIEKFWSAGMDNCKLIRLL